MRAAPTVVVLTDVYSEYKKVLVDTVASTLDASGFGCVCIAGRELRSSGEDSDAAAANRIYDLAHNQLISGLICLSGSIAHSSDRQVLNRFLHLFNLPVVSLGLKVPGVHSVFVDDTGGMVELANHLIDGCERRRIAFLRGYEKDPYSQVRERVLCDALRQHDLPVLEQLFVTGNYDVYDAYDAVCSLITSGERFDAMVCANDLMAISAARAITQHGLSIPHDVLLTGFDDTPEATKILPALTTVRQPVSEMAERGTHMLIEAINADRRKKTLPVMQTLVTGTLVVRGSTNTSLGEDLYRCDGLDRQALRMRLQHGLIGLKLPQGCDLTSIANAFYELANTRSRVLAKTIALNMGLSSSTNDSVHWWNSLCHQLEDIATETFGSDDDIRHALLASELSTIKESVWSRRMEQEFNIQRVQEMRANVLMAISSSHNLQDIRDALTIWLKQMGIKRFFLCTYESPDEKVQEQAKLMYAFDNRERDVFRLGAFPTRNILPDAYRRLLEDGLLILNPVHAGKHQLGFMLLDAEGIDTPCSDALARSIAYSLWGHYLNAQHEQHAETLNEANKRLYRAALHDSLTGLPNRMLFQERLQELCHEGNAEAGTGFLLLFIDLDGFKLVNDTMGHDVGDQLLCEVAERLGTTIEAFNPPQSLIARLGGDEFVVLVQPAEANSQTDAETDAGAVEMIEALLTTVSNPYDLAEQDVRVSASIGCVRCPQDSDDPHTLVKQADSAMYQAKKSGKNRYAWYSEGLLAPDSIAEKLSADVRQGVLHGEFFMHYQPRIQLSSGSVVAVEALMRWYRNVESGPPELVPPAVFIPAAEKAGLMGELDMLALRDASVAARQWEDQGHSITVSVNISVTTLAQEQIVPLILAVIAAAGTRPDRIELEINERSVMSDMESLVLKLKQLRARGVRVAIDDFGTGLSSLSQLHVLPVDTLKIDRSFLTNVALGDPLRESSCSILEAIVSMGRGMKLTVVAEGAETAHQRDELLDIGCEQAQGFLYSTAVPADEISRLLNADSQRAA